MEAKYEELRRMGAEVIGISTDSHWAHRAFAASLGLEFPLVSDFNREVIEEYVGYSDPIRAYRRVNKRAIFVIDSRRIVRWRWEAESPSEIPDTEEVVGAVQEIFHEDDST